MNATKKREKESGTSLTPAAKRERGMRLLAEGQRLVIEATLEETSGRSDYIDQHSSPLGKRRHLDLARAKVFPSVKEGARVLVLRTDLNAYIETHGTKRGVRVDSEAVENVIEDILNAGGGRQ